MAGEYINADSIEDYWNQLKVIYQQKASDWKDLTTDEYNNLELSEREDSDNHLNEERLGKETKAIDICHYKYLPNRVVAYHVELRDDQGKTESRFFQITLKEKID